MCIWLLHKWVTWYTIQHRTLLIIFPLILQTIIIAQTLSNGREVRLKVKDMWATKYTMMRQCVHPIFSKHAARQMCLQYYSLMQLTHTQMFIHSYILRISLKRRRNVIPTSILSFISLERILSVIRYDSSSSSICIFLTMSTRLFLNSCLCLSDIAILMQLYTTPTATQYNK